MTTKKGKAKTAQESLEELEAASVPKVKEFNFADYQIDASPHPITVTIADTGDEFEIRVRDLSWSRRNQILSKSLKWGDGGTTSFDGDGYVRGCLKEMVKEAPWGATTEAFLLSIDERLGNALEGIVPSAFGEGDTAVGLKDVDDLKKE